MRSLLTLILIVFSLEGSAQLIDSNYAVLSFEKVSPSYFPSGSKNAILSKFDIEQIEELMEVSLNEYNKNELKRYNELKKVRPDIKQSSFLIDLKHYKRQFVCAIDPKGDKIVWINCLCFGDDMNSWIYGDEVDPRYNWKTNILVVQDGGNCYFNIKINLTKRKSYDLMVNGEE